MEEPRIRLQEGIRRPEAIRLPGVATRHLEGILLGNTPRQEDIPLQVDIHPGSILPPTTTDIHSKHSELFAS